MSDSVSLNQQTACDECGRFGAFAFDGKNLCGDCYATSGTCGAGGQDETEYSLPTARLPKPPSPNILPP